MAKQIFPTLSIKDTKEGLQFFLRTKNGNKRINPDSTKSIETIYKEIEKILNIKQFTKEADMGDAYAYQFSLIETISPKGDIDAQRLLLEAKKIFKDELLVITSLKATDEVVDELTKYLKADIAASFALTLYNSISAQIYNLAGDHKCTNISIAGGITHQPTFNNIFNKVAKDLKITVSYPDKK